MVGRSDIGVCARVLADAASIAATESGKSKYLKYLKCLKCLQGLTLTRAAVKGMDDLILNAGLIVFFDLALGHL